MSKLKCLQNSWLFKLLVSHAIKLIEIHTKTDVFYLALDFIKNEY